jgi:methylenetetrahydrofolate dehydrogenase (NADP+)/methenyltetrahydrofolate cyclohydrolase
LALLLDGKKLAAVINDGIKKDLAELRKSSGRRPVLACVSIGQDPSCHLYCRTQARAAQELGIEYKLIQCPADIQEHELADRISGFNADDGIDAVMIQHPLPQGLCRETVMEFLSPRKDVEGMHPESLGKVLLGVSRIAPCTAQACFEILKHHDIKLYGREAVVVGHSNVVGKPLALMLLREMATTTVCHIATSEAHHLQEHVQRADILVVAVGKPNVIKGSWVKEGAVVIDVGINRVGESVVGDVEFEEASRRASAITPVPGGVGPVTVAVLMRNVVELFRSGIMR